MARAARIAVDVALYSIKTLRPIISQTWESAKTAASRTSVSFIINNKLTSKAESLFGSATSSVENSLTTIRESQLPNELKYLEREIEKVKREISKSKKGTELGCKMIESNMRKAWPYLKVECAPPMTIALLQGHLGKIIENMASTVASTITGGLKGVADSMDAAVAKRKRDAEAAILAAQAKVKAEAEKRKLEAEQKALDAEVQKEVEAIKKEEDAKAAAAQKASAPKASAPKAAAPKAAAPKAAAPKPATPKPAAPKATAPKPSPPKDPKKK